MLRLSSYNPMENPVGGNDLGMNDPTNKII